MILKNNFYWIGIKDISVLLLYFHVFKEWQNAELDYIADFKLSNISRVENWYNRLRTELQNKFYLVEWKFFAPN